MTLKLKMALLWAGCMLVTSNAAWSCPVCFGETNSNTAAAVNASILVLLVITGAVLSMFGTFIFHLRKRMKIALTTTKNQQ